MKSICVPVALDGATDDVLFSTALSVPGVLAVLVDTRVPAVRVLASTSTSAEIARQALRAFAAN
ncbi:MAG: hypothetical protein ACYDDF_04000 [Thermoplasmatota archaeon]